jgi:hypothetical protein
MATPPYVPPETVVLSRSVSRPGLSVLVENNIGNAALAVGLAGQLRIDNFQEVGGLTLGKHFEFRLPGQLRKKLISVEGHGDGDAKRQLMTAHIFDNDFICRPGRAAVSDRGRRGDTLFSVDYDAQPMIDFPFHAITSKDPRDFKEGAALPLQKIYHDLDRDLPVNQGDLVRLFDWDH